MTGTDSTVASDAGHLEVLADTKGQESVQQYLKDLALCPKSRWTAVTNEESQVYVAREAPQGVLDPYKMGAHMSPLFRKASTK